MNRYRVYLLVFGVIYTLCFCVALLDAAHAIPIYLMLAVRYVMVSIVAYGVVVARIWEGLEEVFRRACKPQWASAAGRILWMLVLAGLLADMASSWSRWILEKASRESALARLSTLAREKRLGIVCEDHQAAFFLAKRAGATDVKYVLAESFPFQTLMRRIQKHYPQPTPISMAEFRQFTNDFVLLPSGKAPVIIHRPAASAR